MEELYKVLMTVSNKRKKALSTTLATKVLTNEKKEKVQSNDLVLDSTISTEWKLRIKSLQYQWSTMIKKFEEAKILKLKRM